jgi:hypothetical protein
VLPVLLGRGMVPNSERSMRFGGREGESIHVWEEAMKAGTVKVGVYINGEKVDDAELLDVRYDRAKTQDRTALTAMFDGNVVCAGSMQRLMSNKAFERLLKRLDGRAGPGTRLKKARKWHMNRAMRRSQDWAHAIRSAKRLWEKWNNGPEAKP